MKILKALIIPVLLIAAYSCNSGPQLMPNISGKAGEVIIVINKGLWESDPGVSLRAILAKDQPFLPQREPMFNLINIPENAFTSIFQTHRNIIIVNVNKDLKEAKTAYQENVWAAPQIVVTISAPDAQSVNTIIQQEQDKLVSALEQAERNRNIQNAKKYEEKGLRELATSTFGGSPYFPKGYNLRKQTPDFIWISYETTYTNQGIFIYRYPYTDSTDFYLPNIVAKRNEFLMNNVPGPLENTYMTTNLMIEPQVKWIKYNKRSFAEMRGLWEVQNDFMGGPFVSHFFVDEDNKYVIAVEAFVYAPRYDKRNYLRQVESLIYSFEFF